MNSEFQMQDRQVGGTGGLKYYISLEYEQPMGSTPGLQHLPSH
jgi:hypothetical protein